MSVLRRGITGFDVHNVIDFRIFKRAVYAATQTFGASVAAFTPSEGVSPSFYQADVSHAGLEFAILCNRHFPVVAFVQRPIAVSNVVPIAVPDLASAIGAAGFEIFG